MFTLARSFRFAAAHTLRSPYLSEEDNKRIYGKCANASGHGHDYTLEFRLSSERLDGDLVFGRGQLDRLVGDHIASRFDRKDINSTLGPAFISSGEHLAIAAFELIRPHLPSGIRLEVRLIETEKNSFVYRGE
jgi:6-pyruvoyltetrahydropterin/6-carboxytetrahydropterin synthase